MSRAAVLISRYAPVFGEAGNQVRLLNKELMTSQGVNIPFLLAKYIKADTLKEEVVEGGSPSIYRLGRAGAGIWSEVIFYWRVMSKLGYTSPYQKRYHEFAKSFSMQEK